MDQSYRGGKRMSNCVQPPLFNTNVSFDVVKEFYDDLALLLNLVKEVDVMN